MRHVLRKADVAVSLLQASARTALGTRAARDVQSDSQSNGSQIEVES